MRRKMALYQGVLVFIVLITEPSSGSNGQHNLTQHLLVRFTSQDVSSMMFTLYFTSFSKSPPFLNIY